MGLGQHERTAHHAPPPPPPPPARPPARTRTERDSPRGTATQAPTAGALSPRTPPDTPPPLHPQPRPSPVALVDLRPAPLPEALHPVTQRLLLLGRPARAPRLLPAAAAIAAPALARRAASLPTAGVRVEVAFPNVILLPVSAPSVPPTGVSVSV